MSAHQHALNTQEALLLARGAEFLCAIPVNNQHLLGPWEKPHQHTALKSYSSISLYRCFSLLISCVNINQINLELQSAQASSLTKYYYQHTSQQLKFNHLHLELQSAQWSRLTNTYILTTRIQSPAS